MEIIQEKIDDLNAVLKIKVAKADYSEAYESSLKNYRKQVDMPGFRKGQVPMGLIKKKYGKSVLAEEVNKLINESIYNHITDNKLDVLGNPLPKENGDSGDWDNPADFEFTYEMGLAPAFEVKVTGRDKFDYYKVKVDDKMLTEETERLRRRFGKLESVDKAEDNDMVFGQFVELDEDKKPKEGGIMHSSTISVEAIEDKKAKKAIVGKKVGDTLTINPKDYSRGEADLAAMLGVKAEDVETLPENFNFTITEVKRMELAEMNQEFFDKLHGEGTVSSEKEFNEKLIEEFGKVFVRDSDTIFKREVSEKLMDKLGLTLPDTFLKRWIQMSNDKPITAEQIEAEYDQYANGLKWQLIENKIVKENEIKVEHAEVLEYTKGLIANNFAQYGMPVPEAAELEKTANTALENKDEARKIYENLYDLKVIAFLKEKVKLNEKEVSYDEFVKIAKGEK